MTRQRLQAAVLILLVGVMVAVYAKSFRSTVRHPGGAEPAPASAVSVSSPGVLLERSEQRTAQRARAAELAWHRDPFTRGASVGLVSGLALSGILWDANAPMAIINGQMVHVGEELEGYRVTEITQDRVSVTDGHQTFQLLITP